MLYSGGARARTGFEQTGRQHETKWNESNPVISNVDANPKAWRRGGVAVAAAAETEAAEGLGKGREEPGRCYSWEMPWTCYCLRRTRACMRDEGTWCPAQLQCKGCGIRQAGTIGAELSNGATHDAFQKKKVQK